MKTLKVRITGSRQQLDKEQLFKEFGFIPGLETSIRKPELNEDSFYYIASPKNDVLFTIDKRLVKIL